MILIPIIGVNLINIFCTNFLYKRHFISFFYVHVTKEKLQKQHAYKKIVRKMLMKLTTKALHGRDDGKHQKLIFPTKKRKADFFASPAIAKPITNHLVLCPD